MPKQSIDTESSFARHPLEKAAGWSWRIVAIAAFIGVMIFVIIELKVIIIPFLVALLVTALLFPLMKWLQGKGIKKGLAVAISLLSLAIVVSGLIFLVAKQVSSAYPELSSRVTTSLENTRTALSAEPFNISDADITRYANTAKETIEGSTQLLTTGVLSSVGSTAGHVVAGAFLALFSVIFLLLDGKNIWKWFVRLFPRTSRNKINEAGEGGWKTLISFVKSQIVVAGVDAVGIGIGAAILQVPLAIPITVMVFLGSFIPVVGAVITGSLAVILALVFNGWIAAAWMIVVVLAVQLLEGHVLQPFLIGKAVKVHPLAIVFAVAIGSLLAGIPGALFAVPIVAVMNVMANILLRTAPAPNAPEKA